jgi:hypothetical protein
MNLALCHLYQEGDLIRAAATMEESLALFRENPERYQLALVLGLMARIRQRQGHSDVARALHAESLTRWHDLGNSRGVAIGLEGLAEVAAAGGEWERSARLLGAEATLWNALGAAEYPTIRADREQCRLRVRASLGEARFAAIWSEGAAMSAEEAVAFALSE